MGPIRLFQRRGVSPVEPRTGSRAGGFLLLLALFVLPAVAILSLLPPPPRPASTAPDSFSAERAARHVEALSRAPHPSGSAEIRQVRAQLLWTIRELGLETSLQRVPIQAPRLADATDGGDDPTRGESDEEQAEEARPDTIELVNILARLPGTDAKAEGAVLLSAHYDTRPGGGPGAADDSAGVATILEVARALLSGPPPRHDVYFFFNDGEELGLLGAQAFVQNDPRVDLVRVVLNFEARGNSGPSIMFETSEGNGPLIDTFARVAPRPVANSLSYTVYRWLPNDTDLTVYKQAGLSGYNFAFIDGHPAYHTHLDTPANLSLASLQHQGDMALALTRHFAAELPAAAELRGRDAVYYNTLGGVLVHYGPPVARATGVALLTALAALWVLGVRRGRWRSLAAAPSAALEDVAATLLRGLVLVLPAYALLWLVGALRQEPRGESLSMPLLAYGLWMLALACASRPDRRQRADELLAALVSALVWALIAAGFAFFSSGPSYLFFWPAVGTTLGLGVWLTVSRDRDALALPGAAVLALSALPQAILVAQAMYLFLLGFAPAPFTALLIAFLLASLASATLRPALRQLDATWRWRSFAGATGAIAFASAWLARPLGF